MQYDKRTAKIARYIPIVAGGALGGPLSIQIGLTDSCFNRCIGCGHPSRQQRAMTAQQWLDVMDTIPGLESVCYSGGDPMAHREFNKVMQHHITRGIKFGATITGFVPPYIDLALMAKAEWIRVSLDAVDPVVYEKVRGRTPVFKVFDGIEAMLGAGVNVELGVTIHPDNEDEWPNVQAYAAAKGIKEVHSRYAYPNSNPRWPDISPEDRGVVPFEHCSAVLYQLYIDADGSVYPCCVTAGDTRSGPTAAALGNILSEPWPAIWAKATEYSRIKRESLPEICRTCCVQRLSEINHVVDNTPTNQSFF